MKLSKRGEYGLKAMIALAKGWSQHTALPIKDIAAHEQIPNKFLEQILLTLKNAGVLQSKVGA
ncbi:MAG: Rrf2 family transcriptional regulator, partial [Chloroflexi bacterium]|nr:Rrf2 family transcriptional regulator [Chloroflexota bacterium]